LDLNLSHGLDRLDGDGGDGALGLVEVGIAGGQRTDGQQVAVAEVLGEGGEFPAQNHRICRGEGQREFFGRRVCLIG